MEIAQQGHTARFGLTIQNADTLMGIAVMCILMVMIVPIPSFLLDGLLAFNITVSLVILMVGMYILKPLEFSSFPSVLLLATLYRLSLNVATTRTILLHGNEGTMAAGRVINAFGQFVVGGNYLVGIIVFIILVTINFIVITKGAGRIAEVAARFTLDAMPGKQMSIDADLNAGLITEQEARERRQLIAKEAEYYGAMDGANKFVRGDAIAGILITLINIIAGFGIGVFQNGMSFADASQTYTVLTVGDGLVSQIPALVVSTAAGIVVSRAGSESSLGRTVSRQIMLQPEAIAVTGVILFGMGLFPGLPTVPFLCLALAAGGLAVLLFRTRKETTEGDTDEENPDMAAELDESFAPPPPLDPLALEIGYGLIPLVDGEQNGELLDRIRGIRHQIAQELGLTVPSIHIQDNIQLKSGEYRVLLKGNELARGELMTQHWLAMRPDGTGGQIPGIPTQEPTYHLPALWIKDGARDEAAAKGYTVVNPPTVIATHLSDIIRRHGHELLGRQDVQHILDTMKASHPKVVEELVPNALPLGAVVRVLQNLLREQIPIRDLLTIFEALADWAPVIKDIDILTEYVRQSLSRTITRLYVTAEGEIPALVLDPSVEMTLADAIQQTEQGSYLALEPDTTQALMSRIAVEMDKLVKSGYPPIVLCSHQIRYQFRRLIDRFAPNIAVLSYNEILNHVQIRAIGTVELIHAD